MGFSIKSQLYNPSTLLNPGKSTNFVFKIEGVTIGEPEIDRINSIASRSKIRDRVSEIKRLGGSLTFVRTQREVFSNNLVLIDSKLPEILSSVVLEFYSSESSTLTSLLDVVESKNPVGYSNADGHRFYEYKLKRFLTDVALGMMPSKVWTGKYDATGGYLVVKENGDILCYHIYNRNQFEDYLLVNTKLDTASTSRYEFGSIYSVDDELFF